MTKRVYPFSGECDNCRRQRDDLFQHPDGNRYCVDVFRCEERYEIQEARAVAEARGAEENP